MLHKAALAGNLGTFLFYVWHTRISSDNDKRQQTNSMSSVICNQDKEDWVGILPLEVHATP